MTFEDASNGTTVLSLDVPARSMTTKVGAAVATQEYISQATVPSRTRLYLRKSDAYSASCNPQQPVTLTLTSAAGTWRQTGGTAAFPNDTSALAPLIVCAGAHAWQPTR